MIPTPRPALGVEPVEDRLLPSPFAFREPPERPALVSRGHDHLSPGDHHRIDPDGGRFQSHGRAFEGRRGPDRREPSDGSRSAREDTIIVILVPVRGQQDEESRRTSDVIAETPPAVAEVVAAADESPDPVELIVAEVSAPVAPRERPVTPSGATASVAFGLPNTPPAGAVPATPASVPPAAVRSTADAPPAARPDRAEVVFLGVVVGTAQPAAERTTVPPVEADPVPEVPVPLVDRVIDAVFPAAVPFAGALPFDATAVEAGAAAVFAHLADLGLDDADDWASPERWAWITSAVLVVGGVTYAVRVRRGRRVDAVVLGTASALARWEEHHADRPS